MTPNYPVFGRYKNNITPQLTSVSGMPGWLTVPPGWFVKANPDIPSELIASPNSDFSNPVYYCCLADDRQTYAFQDQLLLKMLGLDNQYGLQPPVNC